MKIVEKVKDWFQRGSVMGKEYGSILEHPKVNMDKSEYDRINESMRMYRGEYPPISYRNSVGDLKHRPMITLNLMKQVSETLASVVFNDKCKIEITKPEAQEFITRAFEGNDFIKNFSKYLEPMFAIGGLAIRPYIDAEADYNVGFSYAQANTFYPLKSNTSNIKDCAIATKTTVVEDKEAVYYTLLEFHEWEGDKYVISNELYRSKDRSKLGRKVSLDKIYEGLTERAEIEGLTRPIFNYLKPSGFNNINPHSPLGLGVTDNCKDTLRQINDAYDQFNWEIKMGQRKVAVSAHLTTVKPGADGKPVTRFDEASNVIMPLRGEIGEQFIKDLTNDIRSEQYINAINHFIRTLEMQTKLSSGTFCFDGNSVQRTATEIVAENSMTFRTRNMHIVEVESFLKGLIVSTLELASRTTNAEGEKVFVGEIPSFEDIGINFDDGIFTDRASKLELYSKAMNDKLMPRVIAIQRANNIPEDVAREWMHIIRLEGIQHDPSFRAGMVDYALFGRDEVRALLRPIEENDDGQDITEQA